jgi:hypothetical protein
MRWWIWCSMKKKWREEQEDVARGVFSPTQ